MFVGCKTVMSALHGISGEGKEKVLMICLQAMRAFR